ncbi:MAG: hypothetical protein ACRDO8_02645, partial [Nocardioidaceae bacterium]
LYTDRVLPAGAYEPYFARAADEEAEYDALRAAAEHAHDRYGAFLVVAADVEFSDDDPAADVPLGAVASFHIGDELAWYAAQELGDLL